jgi:hypothetical protein
MRRGIAARRARTARQTGSGCTGVRAAGPQRSKQPIRACAWVDVAGSGRQRSRRQTGSGERLSDVPDSSKAARQRQQRQHSDHRRRNYQRNA